MQKNSIIPNYYSTWETALTNVLYLKLDIKQVREAVTFQTYIRRYPVQIFVKTLTILLRIFMVFLSPSTQMLEWYLKETTTTSTNILFNL
jgi:hypothetical protein